jgi:hypothetical protein
MDTLSISHGSHGGKVWEAVGIPTVPTTPYRGVGIWWEVFVGKNQPAGRGDCRPVVGNLEGVEK